jgi:hypothetical protein
MVTSKVSSGVPAGSELRRLLSDTRMGTASVGSRAVNTIPVLTAVPGTVALGLKAASLNRPTTPPAVSRNFGSSPTT